MRMERGFENLRQGTHVCGIYRNAGEALAMIVPYLLAGLKRGEQCVSVVSKETRDETIWALRSLGIDVDDCQPWGQFIFLDAAETYLSRGYFDPETTIQAIAELAKESLSRGFTGLRGVGEMSWFPLKPPGTERLIEYEAKINHYLPKSKAMALCLYNENLYQTDILFDVIRTHPTVSIYSVLRDNPYYFPPDDFFAQEPEKNPDEAYARTKNALLRS
jgi:two-component system, sensor histidine kinase PdtaS